MYTHNKRRHCKNYENPDGGFTLIEILVSLFIVSIVIMFVSAVVNTIKITRDSAYENIAFRIADNKINELRAEGYESIVTTDPFSDPDLARLPQGVASTSVTNWNEKTKQVVVGVSWRDADGLPRFVLLTTRVTQVGGL